MELRKRYRIQIPEEDYPQLASMESTVDVPRTADEGHCRRRSRPPGRNSPTARTRHCHVRHDHHRRRHVGPGGRDPAGPFRPAGLHSRTAHDDRRAELVLSPAAGANYDVGLHAVTNFTPKGTAQRPAGPAAAATAVRWDELGLAPAGRLGDRLSRRAAAISATTSTCFESEVAPAFPAADRQLPTAGRPSWSTTTSSDEPARGRSAREVVGRYHRRSAAGRDALLPAAVLRRRPTSTTWTSASSAIMFRSDLPGRVSPGPSAGVRLILKKLVRKFKQLGGELRLRAGVRADRRRERPRRPGRARRRHRAGGPPRPLVGRLAGDDAAVRRRRPAGDRAGRASCRSSRSISVLDTQPARAGPRPHDRLLQRLRRVPLGEAGRPGRSRAAA